LPASYHFPDGGRFDPRFLNHFCGIDMFAFFSSGLGCLGSIIVSIIGTLILMAVMGVFSR
jgi:hypothetical protein